MQSPIPTISLILLYLLFVRYAPRFMKDRPAIEMKTFLFFFNTAIVILYIYLTREVRHQPEIKNEELILYYYSGYEHSSVTIKDKIRLYHNPLLNDLQGS